MKMQTILLYSAIIFTAALKLFAQNTSPVVSNVAFSISGTTVTVTYDVADEQQATVSIYMKVSSDNGATWDFNYGTASGAIGSMVATGNNKTFTFTYSGGYNNQFKIRIFANDETAGGSPCTGVPSVTYSGQIYNTVQIGDQCWLKENLNVGTMIIGSSKQTNNSTIEKYCYGNNSDNCNTYGGLYQWNEAMQYVTTPGTQGICPGGWHIPTRTEFETLISAAYNVGNALIAIDQGAGTNTSGFSALLTGYRTSNGYFYDLGDYTDFWSSSVSADLSSDVAFYLDLYSDISNVDVDWDLKDYGYSIRCLKN